MTSSAHKNWAHYIFVLQTCIIFKLFFFGWIVRYVIFCWERQTDWASAQLKSVTRLWVWWKICCVRFGAGILTNRAFHWNAGLRANGMHLIFVMICFMTLLCDFIGRNSVNPTFSFGRLGYTARHGECTFHKDLNGGPKSLGRGGRVNWSLDGLCVAAARGRGHAHWGARWTHARDELF